MDLATQPAHNPHGPSDGQRPAGAGDDDMDLQALRDRWLRTIPHVDLDGGDPSRTYKPALADVDDTAIRVADQATLAGAKQAPVDAVASHYELLDELGRGGMGVVFRARQASLDREVAVKKIIPSVRTPYLMQKFAAEARVTGELDHPNIVPIYDFGQDDDGHVLLSMKLVSGVEWKSILHPKSTEDQARAASYDFEKHLRVLVSVCNAVAFAHDKGVVHCDLKPENVMIGGFGEVLVMDWGVAVDIRDDPVSTERPQHRSHVSGPCGTPSYMAPELAEGRGESIGPGTDVYLLGAILYEIAVGRAPHKGDSLAAVLFAAATKEAPEFEGVVSDQVRRICTMAMAKDPRQRYPSVEAFRREVEGLLDHQQAEQLTNKAAAIVEELNARKADRNASFELHELHAKSLFALEHAIESWPDYDVAKRLRGAANGALLEHALLIEDVALATRLAGEVDDDALVARVDALKQSLATKEREISRLRDTARRLDFSAIASPLGDAFIFAGVIIAAGIVMIHFMQHTIAPSSKLPVFGGLWTAICLAVGGFALLRLRHARVPDSLVSSRMVSMWASIAASCFFYGSVVGYLQHSPAFATSATALMSSVGLTVMAFQTRRWLLAPAALCFVTSAPILLWPEYGLLLFAVVWAVVVVGLGVAFKLGASLDG